MREENLLRVDQVASRLNVHRNTVYRWVQDGMVESVRIGVRCIRIPEKEVERIKFSYNAHIVHNASLDIS